MQTRQSKRLAAALRAKSYSWDNSRAKRLGTATEEQWEARRAAYVKACS